MATSVADVALDVVGARRATRAGAASRGLTVGLLTRPPSVGGPAAAENRAAEQYVAQLEPLGARVVEASIPEPPDDTWPLFFHEAAESHRETFPARADEYGDNVRAKLEHAQTVDPDEVDARASRCGAGASTGPRSTSTSRRCSASSCRRRTATSSRCASRLTAFLRPFNVLGWAGLAIGDLQFVAPRDEVVLAAGLAWERGCSGRASLFEVVRLTSGSVGHRTPAGLTIVQPPAPQPLVSKCQALSALRCQAPPENS